MSVETTLPPLSSTLSPLSSTLSPLSFSLPSSPPPPPPLTVITTTSSSSSSVIDTDTIATFPSFSPPPPPLPLLPPPSSSSSSSSSSKSQDYDPMEPQTVVDKEEKEEEEEDKEEEEKGDNWKKEEIDDDDDEDFDEFDFVHTGRKIVEMSPPPPPPDLMMQITELQSAVVEMKSTLAEAVSKLGSAVEEEKSGGGGEGGGGGGGEGLEEMRRSCQENTAEVLRLVISLKDDLTVLQKEVVGVSERQDALQDTLSHLLQERRMLVTDLSQAGVISLHTRSKLEGRTDMPPGDILGVVGGGGGSRGGSGTHSNDSGVALLLERAHLAFGGADHTPSLTPTTHRTSDQDSLPDQPALLVPPSVYDYVAALRANPPAPPGPPLSVTPLQDAPNTEGGTNTDNNERANRDRRRETRQNNEHDDYENHENNEDIIYDSDSSLIIAANKSLSLTTSLSQQCDHHLHNPPTTPTTTTTTTSDLSKEEGGRYCHHHHNHQLLQCCQRVKGNKTTTTNTTVTTTTTNDPYQSPTSMTLTPSLDLSDPREARRYRVARELLDTEKKYCHTLWTIQDTFAEPLKKADILSRKDISTLFPEEVYQLYEKHSTLQHQLRERLGSWRWQPLVGDVLQRFTDPRQSDVLRLYTNYVNDFPEVLKTFRKMCRTSQPFTRFIKGCLEQPACGGLDLGAFLLTPVQRIPRYILLIKQLLRYTDTTHQDHHHLHTCLERLREFLARLNDSMEHSFQLVHIPLGAPPPPPPPPGVLEEEGKVLASLHSYRQEFGEREDGDRRSLGSSSSPNGYHRHHHHHHHHHHVSPVSGRMTQPPRRSTSSLSTPTTSPHHSVGGGGSPPHPTQRSLSSVGGEGRQSRNRQPTDRSSSLPRVSPTYRNRGIPAPLCPPQPRHRSRSESVASRRPIHPHSTLDSPTISLESPDLAPALSVLSVVSREARWKDMSGSEPFLSDSPDSTPTLLAPAPARSTLSVDGHPHTPPHPPVWTEGPPLHSEDGRVKKKSSLRTSLRNMFTFKKSRTASGRPGSGLSGSGEEEINGRYWETSTTASSTTPHHHHHHHHLPQQQSLDSRLSVVGDFVDEEGNPCSNV